MFIPFPIAFVFSRRQSLLRGLMGAVLGVWCAWAQAQSLSAPLVTVNGEVQTTWMAELLLRDQVARGVANTPELQGGVRETLIQRSLMAQEAVKAGLDNQANVKAQLALARQNVLAQAWQQQFVQGLQFQDSDLQAEYQRQIRLLGPKEYRVRHLLVQEEATAKLLLEKVRAGDKVAALAAEYSRDETTKSKGGLTEWTPQGQLLPSILKTIESLQPGQWAPSPVVSPVGWHVVQLEQVRAYVPPEMDKVKPQLVQALVEQRLQERLRQLRGSAKVE